MTNWRDKAEMEKMTKEEVNLVWKLMYFAQVGNIFSTEWEEIPECLKRIKTRKFRLKDKKIWRFK